MAVSLVIFDCDGVMFDSKEANRAYYNHILARFGHPPMDDEELHFVHIHHVADSVRHIFRRYPEDYPKAEEYRKGLDYAPFLKYMRMEPDLIEFLRFLRPARQTAISTNRSTTMSEVLRIFGLAGYFDIVVTAQDVSRAKPDPEALHVILDELGRRVDESVYIGDSEIDLAHTAAVGMRMIAFKNPTLAADFHVSSFMEITRLPIW